MIAKRSFYSIFAALGVIGVTAFEAQACWVNINVINNTGEELVVNHIGTKKKGKKTGSEFLEVETVSLTMVSHV